MEMFDGKNVGSVRGVLVRGNRVFNGPLSRSLRLFARTAHSTHSLRSALPRYARSRARSFTLLTFKEKEGEEEAVFPRYPANAL